MATHYSILAWKIPWKEEPNRLQSIGVQRVGCDSMTKQQKQNHTPRVESHYHRFRSRWRRHEWILRIGKRSEFCVQLGKKSGKNITNKAENWWACYYTTCYGKANVQIPYNRMGIMIDKCWDTTMQMVNSDCPRPSKCLCSSSPFLETLKSFPESSIKWLNL